MKFSGVLSLNAKKCACGRIHSTIFKATKDIRVKVKYVLSHLAWDLGVEDELYR